jgi:hypothetical protein
MKVYLEKFNDLANVLVIDLEDINVIITQKNTLINDNVITGKYFDFGNDIVGVFCFKKQIFLYYNKSIHKYDETIQVNYNRKNEKASISFDNPNSTSNISYDFDLAVSTLTYSEEDEDSDFGLWLSNVLNTKERRDIFVEFN